MERTRYGQYEVVRQLGEGGMGVVYLARHLTLDRVACVKVMLREPTADRTPVARFLGEARAVAKLNHAHIISIYDCDETEDGVPFIALEYLEGMPLSSWLTSEARHGVAARQGMPGAPGAVHVRQVVRILGQLASALQAAHRAGIVHRDVKPDNVFLVVNRVIGRPDDMHVVLLDFGVAKLRETDLTATGHGMGTPAYMAPEQFGDAKRVDARADVYALGAIAYKMLTGGWYAWADERNELSSPQEIYRRQTTEAPPDPRSRNPGISEALANVIRRALVCDPRDRWESAADFARAVAETVPDDGTAPSGGDLLRNYAPDVWDANDPLWGLRAFMPPVPVAPVIDASLWKPPPTAVSWKRASLSTAAASPRALAGSPFPTVTSPEAATVSGAALVAAGRATLRPRRSRRRLWAGLAGAAALGLVVAAVALAGGGGGSAAVGTAGAAQVAPGAGAEPGTAGGQPAGGSTVASPPPAGAQPAAPGQAQPGTATPPSSPPGATAPAAPTGTGTTSRASSGSEPGAGLTPVAVLTDPPGAAIFVDGDLADDSSPARLTLAPGRTVRIRAELPGRPTAETTHLVGTSAETVRLSIPVRAGVHGTASRRTPGSPLPPSTSASGSLPGPSTPHPVSVDEIAQ